ncbi:hypothetical protein [Pelovirga terrestris]|uniref:Uncharacterized protein n=1 Tax=Pelovirga terrestris TaxID=2771352 RepID=A0A8J6QP32_9BACT|nr:hypothetical protein [Pelovirga terrestris]MBD1400076.1 hypothetical protein [Pelovirga terrestris]
MRILLINPPNCGRSIPEERYGITSIKKIFRSEPLALEALAGPFLWVACLRKHAQAGRYGNNHGDRR